MKKKVFLIGVMMAMAVGAFAYYGNYGYSHSDEMSGFQIFMLIVMIAYIILSIVILVRWWKMTQNVEVIRNKLTPKKPELTLMVVSGEKEQAEKEALKLVVGRLYNIYCEQFEYSKARAMNDVLESLLPPIEKLGLKLPEYVKSGEKFIDHMNGLTGRDVKCKDPPYGSNA